MADHRWGKKDPQIIAVLEQMASGETAGDPMSERKWVRGTLEEYSRRLGEVGHWASPPTVGKLLREELGYSLRGNVRNDSWRTNEFVQSALAGKGQVYEIVPQGDTQFPGSQALFAFTATSTRYVLSCCSRILRLRRVLVIRLM